VRIRRRRADFRAEDCARFGPVQARITSWKYGRFVAHGVDEKISDPGFREAAKSAVCATRGRVKICRYEGIKECDPRGDTDPFQERGEWV
jgi:hypothetical protein